MLKKNADAVIPTNEFYIGRLKNEEILIKSKVAAKFPINNGKDFYGLNGTKLYGLRFGIDYRRGGEKVSYWEIELNGRSEDEYVRFEFEFTFDIRHMEIKVIFIDLNLLVRDICQLRFLFIKFMTV